MLSVSYLYFDRQAPMPAHLFDNGMSLLPVYEQEKIEQFHRWQDAQAGMLGKILLRRELMKIHPTATDILEQLTYSRFRKPFLENVPVDFNISHSGNVVVCAVSTHGRIGVDVEVIQPVELSYLAPQMQETEWQAIQAAPDIYRSFFYHWTRKEALLKANGKGLHLPMNAIAVHTNSVIIEEEKWYLSELNLGNEVVCHLATACPVLENEIQVQEIFFDVLTA
ncbi:4'-phosphopantetheinyl transferase family protein [Chitinophaga eiseniae]|uniref:4'-phosphopantetheinyl transferase superfamily protein n=1 Tax=Chitinophaga eiseniae TaxID=634771 RepID=A0A847SC44_9BACT|nr:4'-phosphopantetheinyl transferase superfamily protein [Chitinophaga eiseniae]NLR77734.1 4'-phosphopantetheinyl transferase superfamily protein [Chitinophaga eiseniae]